MEVYYNAKRCIKSVLENTAKVLEFYLTNLCEPCESEYVDVIGQSVDVGASSGITHHWVGSWSSS